MSNLQSAAAIDRLATIASEAFGPLPVQPPEQNLTAIEQGIYQLRTDNDKLERERNQAREDLDEEMKFHHRTHGECVRAQCELMDVKNERDLARNLAESAMLEADRLRSQLWRARDRAWKLARERNYWKSDCLEQCKLLAISADREEKMRDAFRYIARLDTSQDASPQQCSAVAVAMEALR